MPEDKTAEIRRDFMSDEEIQLVDTFLRKIDARRAACGPDYTRWDAEEEAYLGDQVIEDDSPNTRVNIVNANVEGQVASLVEQNLAVTCRGEGPSDQGFADWGRIGLDWTLRKNHIKRLLDRHERRRELFGPAWFKLTFDSEAIKGFGLATISCPPLQSMFVDGKVSDPFNLQSADYVAEVMERSKSWAVEKYGDMAEQIHYGGSDKASIFTKEYSAEDDKDLFWLVQIWTMSKLPKGKKHVLRLIECSDDGILLSDSFRKWSGSKFSELGSPKPFYRYNRYPYWLTNLYYEEGKLLGFGDGKLLRPLQDMLNDLYDQIRRQAKPPRVFFDPNSEVDLDALENSDGAVPCVKPRENIFVPPIGQVNDALWRLLGQIHDEIQRVVRFSELMMSMAGEAGKTATESAIQQQQGTSGIDHKKLMLQETLIEVCEYVLDLMMEHYTEAKAFRIDEDKEDYAWIDFRQMSDIPAMVPVTEAYEREWKAANPTKPVPPYMQLLGKDGKGLTRSVDLDIDVTIGAGLPKNKAFLYQMLEKLAPIVAIDKMGMQKPILTWEELRHFIGDFLGLPLEEPAPAPVRGMMPQPGVPGQPQPPPQAIPSPTAQGVTAAGAVQAPTGGVG